MYIYSYCLYNVHILDMIHRYITGCGPLTNQFTPLWSRPNGFHCSNGMENLNPTCSAVVPRSLFLMFLLWSFPKMGVPQIIQVMKDHDLILKPMVTWGSPIWSTSSRWVCTSSSGVLLSGVRTNWRSQTRAALRNTWFDGFDPLCYSGSWRCIGSRTRLA